MRTTQALFFTGIALFAAASFSWSQDKPTQGTRPTLAAPHDSQVAAPARAKTAADYRIIGYLEGRGRTITIKAGPKGPLYSVKTPDGKVLCENLSQEQLSAQAPEIGEFLKRAVAGAPGVKADARVRVMGLR